MLLVNGDVCRFVVDHRRRDGHKDGAVELECAVDSVAAVEPEVGVTSAEVADYGLVAAVGQQGDRRLRTVRVGNVSAPNPELFVV